MAEDLEELKLLLLRVKRQLDQQRQDSDVLFKKLTQEINGISDFLKKPETTPPQWPSMLLLQNQAQTPLPPLPKKEPVFPPPPAYIPVLEKNAPHEESKKKNNTPGFVEQKIGEWKKKLKDYNWSQWEMIIGTNWLARIGIIVIALGVIFFMKFSFDNNYISPSIRILMAMALGMACLISGEYFNHKKMPAQVQVFWGGGILILYSAIVVAKHYPFISGTVLESNLLAIVFMVLVTAVAYLAALRYDSPAIAAIGLIGGFLAPLVVGKPSGKVAPLLFYLVILGSASFVLEYRKNWQKLFATTVFLAFFEPLVLSYNGSEQHSLLFVYLLLMGIGCLVLASFKEWRGTSYSVLTLICAIPVLAYLRTSGSLAHPAVIYAYCLFTCVASVGVSVFKGWKKMGQVGLTAAFILPLVLVHVPLSLARAYLPWLVILPLGYNLILTLGSLLLIAQKRMADQSKIIGLAGLFFPTMIFIKTFHLFFPLLGLGWWWGWEPVVFDFQTTWTLASFAYLAVLLLVTARLQPQHLLLLIPLSYIPLKMTVFPELLASHWFVLFGYGLFCAVLGLVQASKTNNQNLARTSAVFGFILPVAIYMQIPEAVWITAIFIYALILLGLTLALSSMKKWQRSGWIAIAGAFLLPIFSADLFLIPAPLVYTYTVVALTITLYFAHVSKEESFALIAFLGAWILPIFIRGKTLDLFYLPYGYALLLTTLGLGLTQVHRWKNILALTILGWLCFPLLTSHAGILYPKWVCLYGLITASTTLFIAQRSGLAKIGVAALAAAYLLILSLYPVATPLAFWIYAYCIAITAVGLAVSFIASEAFLSYAAIAGGFLTPLWIFNLSQPGYERILAYGIVILSASFGQSFFKKWRWVIAIPVSLFVGVSAYTLMAQSLLMFIPHPSLFFGYGFLILLLVAAVAYFKDWRHVLSCVALMALCFGLASAFSANTIPYRHTYLCYILGINVLGLALAQIKKWPQTKNAVLTMTVVMTSLVFINTGQAGAITYPQALTYLSIFFALYFTSTVVENSLSDQTFDTHDWVFLLATPTYAYGWAYWLLKTYHPALLGPVAILLGTLYAILGALILRKSKFPSIDAFKESPRYPQLIVLLGIASAFVTLAIPIQLDPRLITIAWAVECAVLCWAGCRLKEIKIRWASYVIFTLTLIRYYRHDLQLADGHHFITNVAEMSRYAEFYHAFLSTRFIAGLFVVALVFWFSYLHHRYQNGKLRLPIPAILFTIGNLLFLWLFTTEVGAYLVLNTEKAADVRYRELVYSILWALHATTLLSLGLRYRNSGCRGLGLILFGVVLVKVFTKDIWAFNQGIRILAFILLGVLLIASGLLYTKYKRRLDGGKN